MEMLVIPITHRLLDALATNRAKVALPQSSRRGGSLPEERVKSLKVGYITRKLGAIKAQCVPVHVW